MSDSVTPEMEWNVKCKLVADACYRHEGLFGLRAFPGEVFKVVESASYWSELEHRPLLYTYVWDLKQNRWLSFSKGTEAELRDNKTKLTQALIDSVRFNGGY